MKKIPVVTSFIRNSGKILILKRSDKVGSFPGHWHGVSGYMEKGDTPIKRAYAEIRQETGLLKKDIEFVHQGGMVSVKEKINWYAI